MDFRTCSELSILKGDRAFTLHIPPNATVGELLDVSFQILAEAKQRAMAAAEAQMPKEAPSQQE